MTGQLGFPPPQHTKACSFFRGFEYDVPLMLRTYNPMKRHRAYQKMLLHMKPGYFKCIGDPNDPICHNGETSYCGSSVDGTIKHGWPCIHNHYLNELAFQYYWQEHGRFIVANSEAGHFQQYLHNECMSEGIVNYVQFPAYGDQPILSYIEVLAKYGRCQMKLGANWKEYCPDPCKNPSACSKDNMLSICYSIDPQQYFTDPKYKQDNKYQILIDTEYFAYIKPLFKKIAYCECITGFKYNPDKESCEPVSEPCSKGDECLHSGICKPVPDSVYEIIGRRYNCECKPAWQGLRCEEPRNPCRIPSNTRSCGSFQCRRSPLNEEHGFICMCSEGYTLTRQSGMPSCRDVNECAVSTPCRNGGNCNNLEGSFECTCSRGFTGRLCETPPPTPYWLDWDPWTDCSVTCSVGVQYRYRSCSSVGRCLGIRKDFKNCVGRREECSDELRGTSLADIRRRSTEEDNNIVDDAWYYREYQLLQLGLKKRSEAEDELMTGFAEEAYDMAYILILLVIEIVVLLLLHRRNRVHLQV